MADQPTVFPPAPWWSPLLVTAVLLVMAGWLFWEDRYPALSGAIVGSTIAYWLPTRPNRQPAV